MRSPVTAMMTSIFSDGIQVIGHDGVWSLSDDALGMACFQRLAFESRSEFPLIDLRHSKFDGSR